MEFALYFNDTQNLNSMEEALRNIDAAAKQRRFWSLVERMLFSDPNTHEYRLHLGAMDFLEQMFGDELPYNRLYFGQEFCQYLMPSPEEVLMAYYFSRQLGWGFTYVTGGAVTDRELDSLRTNLQALRDENASCEVVVNNWGILREISTNWAEFHPVLGRMLCRQIRFPSPRTHTLTFNTTGIETGHEEIGNNQIRSLRQLEVSIDLFREELTRLGVDRFEIDIVPQGVELPDDSWGFGVNCYFPWTYITSGRNCVTAADDDPQREYVPKESPCPRLCQHHNRSNHTNFVYPTIHRGNSVFLYNMNFAKPYFDNRIPIDRIVVSPYIPI